MPIAKEMPCRKLCFCECFCDCFPHNNIRCVHHAVIKKAVIRLIKNDRYLLENQANERSQTHKLAEYLQDALPEWNVDCEYDRNMNDPKRLDFNEIVDWVKGAIGEDQLGGLLEEVKDKDVLTEVLKKLREELTDQNQFPSEGNLEAPAFLMFTTRDKKPYIKKVFPDVITHIRGTKNNQIIVEAKKATNKDSVARWFDLIKLSLFTQRNGAIQFGYQAGYFIDLPEQIPEHFFISFSRDQLVQNLDKTMRLGSNVWVVEIKPV